MIQFLKIIYLWNFWKMCFFKQGLEKLTFLSDFNGRFVGIEIEILK